MRIFALETDIGKIKQRYCHADEREVLFTNYHTFAFFFAVVREVLLTIALFGIGVVGWVLKWPMVPVVSILAAAWMVFVFFNALKAYIDWCFDFILVTTDNVILVDQTSLFHQEVRPVHVSNIGGVSTHTQFWNVFPFGTLIIHLKEGLGGQNIIKHYVPRVQEVASSISDIVMRQQRRIAAAEAPSTL